MATVKSTFETLAGGTVPTTANTNYSNVTPGASNTLITDSSITRAGKTSSLKHQTASTNANYAYWNVAGAGFGGGLQRWFRTYLWIPSTPVGTHTVIGFLTSGLGSLMSARLSTGLRINMYNAAGAAAVNGSFTLPTGAWVRLEGMVLPGTGTTDGQASISIYATSPDGTTPDETLSTSTGNFGTIAPALHFTGVVNGTNGANINLSDVAFSDSGAIGPDANQLTQAFTDLVGASDFANPTTVGAWSWAYSLTQG